MLKMKKFPVLGKTDDIGGQFSVGKNDFGHINFPLSRGKYPKSMTGSHSKRVNFKMSYRLK